MVVKPTHSGERIAGSEEVRGSVRAEVVIEMLRRDNFKRTSTASESTAKSPRRVSIVSHLIKDSDIPLGSTIINKSTTSIGRGFLFIRWIA